MARRGRIDQNFAQLTSQAAVCSRQGVRTRPHVMCTVDAAAAKKVTRYLAYEHTSYKIHETQPLRPSPAGRVGPGGAGGVRGTLRRN